MATGDLVRLEESIHLPELPLSAIDRLLRKHLPRGTRIEKNALETIRKYLEETTEKIAKESVDILLHVNKKTLTRNEIELVLKKMK